MDGENYNLAPSEKPTVLRNVNTGDVPHELVSNKLESMKRLYEMTDFAEIEGLIVSQNYKLFSLFQM
jgi:hypothetical protein